MAIVAVLVAAGLFHPLRHIIRNHPNTYIYFNEWSGGINNTYGRFETDYYANSLKPASDYFLENILPGMESSPDQTPRVVSNSDMATISGITGTWLLLFTADIMTGAGTIGTMPYSTATTFTPTS